MSDNIKLNNPTEVMNHIIRIPETLEKNLENIRMELAELMSYEDYILETERFLNERKVNLQIELHQNRSMGEDSEYTRGIIQNIQIQLSKCDEHIQKVKKCHEELLAARQDEMLILKEGTELLDVGKTLSVKVSKLITRIMEEK